MAKLAAGLLDRYNDGEVKPETLLDIEVSNQQGDEAYDDEDIKLIEHENPSSV